MLDMAKYGNLRDVHIVKIGQIMSEMNANGLFDKQGTVLKGPIPGDIEGHIYQHIGFEELAKWESGSSEAPLPKPDTTDVITLTKLAAEGKFFSVHHLLPEDVIGLDVKFLLDGEPVDSAFVTEAYCPGDETGWIVSYVEGKYVATELRRGNCTAEVTRPDIEE